MRKLVFTKEMLEDYYENRFAKDLNDFFIIENVGNAQYVEGFKKSLQFVFNSHSISYANAADPRLWPKSDSSNAPAKLPKQEISHKYGKRGAEEEILFIAFISYMFASEEAVCRLTGGGLLEALLHGQKHAKNDDELASCMSAFGFPWIRLAIGMELSSFLSKYQDELCIHIKEEVEAIRDAMTLVVPYMSDKLIPFLKKWDNGSFCAKIRFFDTLSEHLNDCISRELTVFYRSLFYEHKGLSHLSFTQREFDEYYKKRFPQQLCNYFSDAKFKGNYLLILDVPYNNNKRWEDGNPGGNIADNFMFATFILFLTMAQQSILEIAKDSSEDFHQCTGWPMISSGPGGGPYLHPLYMLEYAGLAPMKYESHLLSEMVKRYFPYFRQEINTILNGNVNSTKDIMIGKRFVEAIKNGNGARINKYLDKEEKSIQNLLVKWPTSSAKSLKQLLEDENIPIILEYK